MKKKKWNEVIESEIDDEFYRLVEILAQNHDIDVICDLVNDQTKREYVIGYHNEDDLD